MYDKEVSGKKPNTLRVLTFEKEQQLKKATHVRIRRGYTKRHFIKKITDKTKWKNEWIISWNPNTSAKAQKEGLEMVKNKALKFFKCYRSDVSCIDCEFKEVCNVFVYVKQQAERTTQ